MSCQTLPCWSEKAELSVERMKAVNPSNDMLVGSGWDGGDVSGWAGGAGATDGGGAVVEA